MSATVFPVQETEGFLTRFQYGVTDASHTLSGTTDAIPVSGKGSMVGGWYFITNASVDAITLATPVSGAGFGGAQGGTFPQLNGQDDMEITFVSVTAAAHTITTASNIINGNKHIATSGGAIGNVIRFRARAGVWWMFQTIGFTLS